MEDKRTRKHDQKMNEKRDKRLGEKLQLETEKISAEDKISEWMKSADRRRSSTRHVIKTIVNTLRVGSSTLMKPRAINFFEKCKYFI